MIITRASHDYVNIVNVTLKLDQSRSSMLLGSKVHELRMLGVYCNYDFYWHSASTASIWFVVWCDPDPGDQWPPRRQIMCIRLWFAFLTLHHTRQSLLISLLTPFIIDFWWLCKSFMDRLMLEKWYYLLGNSAVDCSNYTCSSIKVVSAQATAGRTQLRGKQQQQ